jgi:endoglucanase
MKWNYHKLLQQLYQEQNKFGGGFMVKLAQGFVKTDGKKIVDGSGQELLLRGVGLGNWLLPEGYMWKFKGADGDRPRRIEKLFIDLIGKAEAHSFWQRFGDNYIREEDVKRIAEEGFNSIRVPMNSRHLFHEDNGQVILDEHIHLIDRFIEWCKKYDLYVILDLHGAPGGQTGHNIDDSVNNHPELFIDEENKVKTIKLWRKLAERYKDEWIVAGYDLLNEPLPQEQSKYFGDLLPLYEAITDAIREVDKNHMIILEGAHWATNFSMITRIKDYNTALQPHKYWNNTDEKSIRHYLNKREELNVPLWLGETGENNNDWYRASFRLLESFNIGWNFWPWKKLDTVNTPCSINPPEDWDKILAFAAGGEHPGEEEAKRILDEYLNNTLIENCTYHKEVIDAMMGR